MKKILAEIDDFIKEYENGTITISDDIEWPMRETVKQITHYILSRYMDGGNDNKDPITKLRRPFRNIGNFIVDLEWRAKNIDRKSIEAHATDGDHLFSLVTNKELQLWMKNNNFGATIDDYQRKKSEYGGVLLKKTELDDELIIDVVQWSNVSVDPSDISGGMKVEAHDLTLLDLRKKAEAWDVSSESENETNLELAVALAMKKKERRIQILDIEGEFLHCDVYEDEDSDDETIGLYNLKVAVVGSKKFVVYREKLKESRFKYFSRKKVEQRDLGLGVWEEVFESQINTNEAVIAQKEAVDLGGKVVIKTNKAGLRDGMSLMQGELIDLDEDEIFEPVSLSPRTFPEYQALIDAWFLNTQRDQSAFPGVSGEEPKSSTPGISLELQAAQGGSIFNKRRDQDGYDIIEVIVDWVLPFIVKKINKEHKLTASYSATELQLLDEAITNDRMKNAVMLKGGLVTLELKEEFKANLRKQGDTRTLTVPPGYITMKKIKQKLRFDITDEMKDDQRHLNALAMTLSTLAPDDPARAAIIAEMMEITGLSAATFPIGKATEKPTMPKGNSSTINDVLPEGQKV